MKIITSKIILSTLLATLFLMMLLTNFDSFVLRYFKSPPFFAEFYIPQAILTVPEKLNPDVIFVGGSSLREYFEHDDFLSRSLSSRCGRNLEAFNGATSSQSLVDSLAIVDSILKRGGSPQLVVVGLTKFRLSNFWPEWQNVLDQQRLALPPPEVLVNYLPFFSRVKFRANNRFARFSRVTPLIRLGDFFTDQDYVYEKHLYLSEPLSVEKKRERSLLANIMRQQMFEDYSVENAKRYRILFEDYKRYGIEIVFVFTPKAPSTQFLNVNDREYLKLVTNILGTVGPVIDLDEVSSLPEEAFFDEQHLVPMGRELLRSRDRQSRKLHRLICKSDTGDWEG